MPNLHKKERMLHFKRKQKMAKCAKRLTFTRKSKDFISKGNEKMANCAKCPRRRFHLKKKGTNKWLSATAQNIGN
jgi:hypothetical protein